MRNACNTVLRSVALALTTLAPQWAQAQTTQTCADLQWGGGIAGNMQAINSPSAATSKKMDGLQVKADANKRKTYLSCPSGALQGLKDQSHAEPFHQAVSTALHTKTLTPTVLAQAVYLVAVFQGKYGAHESNTPASQWHNEQAKSWCELNAKGQNPEDVKLPAKLPTLGEGVQTLNPRAIALSWQVLQGLPVQQLKESCATAVARFVKQGN